MVKICSGHLSITGNVRENNEDRLFVDSQGRFFLVADGMGGQCAGEKASELAVQIIPRRLDEKIDFANPDLDGVPRTIDDAVAEANAEIMALGELDPAFNKMGTTVVFLIAVGDELFVGGVGDSRVYRLRDGKFEQLTTDHSLTQALLDAGTITPEEAAHHKYRNMLYRYLGCKEGGAGTNSKRYRFRKGDRFVLCSDGVSDGLSSKTLQQVLESHSDPQDAAEKIVQAALDGGSRDNITCVVVNAT